MPLEGAAPGPAAWLSYLSVPDLDRAVAQVGSAGGKVLLPPPAVGAYGRVAVVTDPQGAPLGLAGVTGRCRTSRHSPSPTSSSGWSTSRRTVRRLSPSTRAWRDTTSVTASENGIDYNVLKTGGARGAAADSPAFEGPAALAALRPGGGPGRSRGEGVALGGKVVIEPRADVRRGTLAIVADPTGAALALQKWPL